MEIFRYNIVLSWGDIYLGLKKQWISPNDVFKFCNENKIGTCNSIRIAKLYLSFDESLFEFYEQIKQFVAEDIEPVINKNEDEIERSQDYIPSKYWDVWKLEFLLRVYYKDSSAESKLIEISEYFHVLDFPDEWKDFIYYQPVEDGTPKGNNILLRRFQSYVEKLIHKRD